jgi:hypothetical protein
MLIVYRASSGIGGTRKCAKTKVEVNLNFGSVLVDQVTEKNESENWK